MNNYVSLLPPEYVKRLKKAADFRKAAFIMLIVAIISFAALAISLVYRVAEKQKIAAVMSEVEQVRLQIGQLSEIESRQQDLIELRDRIVEVQSKDPLLINSAAEIVKMIPPGVKLETMTLSMEKNAAKICVLTCTGTTYDDIARFMNALTGSDRFAGVVSDSSNNRSDGGVEFTLTITIEAGTIVAAADEQAATSEAADDGQGEEE